MSNKITYHGKEVINIEKEKYLLIDSNHLEGIIKVRVILQTCIMLIGYSKTCIFITHIINRNDLENSINEIKNYVHNKYSTSLESFKFKVSGGNNLKKYSKTDTGTSLYNQVIKKLKENNISKIENLLILKHGEGYILNDIKIKKDKKLIKFNISQILKNSKISQNLNK